MSNLDNKMKQWLSLNRISSELLNKKLKEWVSFHFISKEQAESIQNYEDTKTERSWMVHGFLILGVIVIGIGIISLIAANWDQITDGAKLAVDFILLTVTGAWILNAYDETYSIKTEALLFFFMLLCLASIGLIGQIYHTGGRFYQALLLWSLITFPVIFFARHMLIPFLWVGALLIGGSLEVISLNPVFQNNLDAIFIAIPLLCVATTFIIRTFGGRDIFIQAFRRWTILSGLTGLVGAELEPWFRNTQATSLYIPVYILAGFVAFLILQDRNYRMSQKSILLVTIGVFLMSFTVSSSGIRADFLHATFTILELALLSIFWASLKKRDLFQLFVFLIGMRFLILYFQALGGLAVTGAGLIVSGVLIILMAVLWGKYRKGLTTSAERWMQ